MKRIFSALCLVSMLWIASPAFADTKTHKASQVSFWLPDNWTLEGEDKDQLQASDPKGQVSLLFMVSADAKDMKTAVAALDATIAKVATDVKLIAPAKKVTLNGMETAVVDATGKADGKAVELSILIIKTPSKKFLTIFGILEADQKKVHEASLRKIVESIKPMKKFGD